MNTKAEIFFLNQSKEELYDIKRYKLSVDGVSKSEEKEPGRETFEKIMFNISNLVNDINL